MTETDHTTVTIPATVLNAIKILLHDFLNVDYPERIEYLREKEPHFVDAFKAAAKCYEEWKKEAEEEAAPYRGTHDWVPNPTCEDCNGTGVIDIECECVGPPTS